jgi:type VI secretion system secreted protein Hcp
MADMFLDLGNVKGETLDSEREGEIEIKNWNWSITNDAPYSRGGQQASTASVANVTINKIYDKATSALIQYCLTGQHIPQGILTCYKNAGDMRMIYLTITLTNVMVRSVTWGPQSEDFGIPEVVVLSFASFDTDYALQENEGHASGWAHYHFDIPSQTGSG